MFKSQRKAISDENCQSLGLRHYNFYRQSAVVNCQSPVATLKSVCVSPPLLTILLVPHDYPVVLNCVHLQESDSSDLNLIYRGCTISFNHVCPPDLWTNMDGNNYRSGGSIRQVFNPSIAASLCPQARYCLGLQSSTNI